MRKNIREEYRKQLQEKFEQLPGQGISRKDLAVEGGLSAGYLANLDMMGKGPEGGFYQGKKKFFLKNYAIEWLVLRIR